MYKDCTVRTLPRREQISVFGETFIRSHHKLFSGLNCTGENGNLYKCSFS